MVDDETSAALLTYFLGTPGLRRRIEDVAFVDTAGHPEEVVTWNGLTRAIEETRAATAVWARSMVSRLDAIGSSAGPPPGMPSENPYWIWAGAVLEGFFTVAEMADAVRFIEAHFSDLSAGERWPRLEFEMYAFLSLLSLVVEHEKMQRMTEFCNLAGFGFLLPEPEPEPSEEPALEESGSEEAAGEWARDRPGGAPIGRMPKLSPPHSVAPFPQEGSIDPMAQDPDLLAAAAATFSGLAARMARAAHAVGAAVTLPTADEAAAHGKPWRSVVPVWSQSSEQTITVDEPPELWLVQRLFTSAQAVAARTGGEVPDGLAELMEEIGYVAIGRSHEVRDRPRLHAFHSLGAMAAVMHHAGFVHGDLQPQNFTFKEESGDIASMFDLGRAANPGRPLTVLERASDLAVLKKHASFLEWEAAKLGYRSRASDADAVLAQFGGPDG
jgi:hypothetical protein